MSDTENVEREGAAMSVGGEKGGQPVEFERLSRLPLEALLYYVLYGDEQLVRLTQGA